MRYPVKFSTAQKHFLLQKNYAKYFTKSTTERYSAISVYLLKVRTENWYQRTFMVNIVERN